MLAAASQLQLMCRHRYTFSRLPFLEKKERVSDLFHYVLGIRIFNLFLGKVASPPCITPHPTDVVTRAAATSALLRIWLELA